MSATSQQQARDSALGTARVVVRRQISASPEEVFEAWTDAEGMRQWMRPGPTADARITLDVRKGGSYRIDMIRGADVYEHRGEYLEVDPPRRLQFTWISKGTKETPSVVTVELTPSEGGTALVLTHERLPDAQAATGHEKGWSEIVDQLVARYAR